MSADLKNACSLLQEFTGEGMLVAANAPEVQTLPKGTDVDGLAAGFYFCLHNQLVGKAPLPRAGLMVKLVLRMTVKSLVKSKLL